MVVMKGYSKRVTFYKKTICIGPTEFFFIHLMVGQNCSALLKAYEQKEVTWMKSGEIVFHTSTGIDQSLLPR